MIFVSGSSMSYQRPEPYAYQTDLIPENEKLPIGTLAFDKALDTFVVVTGYKFQNHGLSGSSAYRAEEKHEVFEQKTGQYSLHNYTVRKDDLQIVEMKK